MTEVNEERVHEIFNTISEDYDKMNSIISFKQHDLWRAQTMKKMGNLTGQKVLDLCCGTGDWLLDLAEAVGESGQATGLDFSENMLAIAQAKVAKRGDKNIELIQGNAMELPFANQQFDVVTIGYGLRNTPNYLTVLSEIYRVLKPGGRAVCIETSHPTLPVYKQAFELYFENIMPLFGKLFAKSYEEYRWLQKSAKDFPNAKVLKDLFEQAGFSAVEYKMHGGGAVATHFAKKSLKPKSNIRIGK
ncbi:demethylmenaquinone methyltransferase [Lactococcus allomyrinae]|uniref:Demethylmenaquinone methyltransferase n=1 Tax=Lactococcus allomyrinae TaxID=2419773 RepID=A0A387BA37_9LACT|nr:demethylmenaquinone methyltransferase [Lactococcus allomyrinae]AYG00715.1 demethylmenaquinone methyltransferase [Lactococcus allomyrinae]